MACVPSEDSDQPSCPDLIRVFAVCMKKAWVLSYCTNWVRSEDSDQTGLMPRLIWVSAQIWWLRSAKTSSQIWSVFAVCMKKAWVLNYPLSAQRRLWSDWADAQADLSLCWGHSHIVGFVIQRLTLYVILKHSLEHLHPCTYHFVFIFVVSDNYFLRRFLWYLLSTCICQIQFNTIWDMSRENLSSGFSTR